MKRKRVIRSIILLAIIALLVSVLPLPVRINKTISGIQWKDGDPAYSEPADIRINGTYKMYLFKHDVFKGHITITNNKLTYSSKASLFEITFNDYNNMKSGGLIYYSSIYHNFMDGGTIYISGAFKHILISEYDKNKGTYYISAPATDRKSAFELAVEMGYVDFYNLS
jgi:hypothetical protein